MEHDGRLDVRDAAQQADGGTSIEIVRRDDVAILTPEGELDVDFAPLLRDTLRMEFDLDRSCIVDLRRVSFVDSSILGSLLAAQRFSASRGPGFAVVLGAPHSPVRRLFEVVMVAFPVYDDVDSAMAAIGRRDR